MTTDLITLTVNGKNFSGWTEMSITRAIDRLKSEFSIAVTDPWSTNADLWQITPFSPCQIAIGGDLILTGYVEEVAPEFDANRHRFMVRGSSKTCDLVQCTPDIPSGQFKGYTLEQIARAICKLFGITVIVQTDASQIFPDATLQRGEKAFSFLERLGRLAGVLLCDDVNGNLVLCTAGSARASGTLVQGQNILSASAKINVENRFSIYIVKGQKALGSTDPYWGDGETDAPPAPVQTALRATAADTGVPRYRPKTSLAEAQLDAKGMQLRATWERNFAFGRATMANITVPGWRQPDNTLWRINTLVNATSPFLSMAQDLLIAETKFMIGPESQGKRTQMRLGPVEGFTPSPGEVKLHCQRGKKGKTAPNWDGVGVAGP